MYELINNLIFHQVGLEKALLHSLLECLRLSACFKARGKTVGNLRAQNGGKKALHQGEVKQESFILNDLMP